MKKVALLAGCLVMILTATAAAAEKKVYNPVGAAAHAPFSQAVEAAGLVFTSGQIPVDAQGNIPKDFKNQMKLALDNVRAALELAGSGMDKVVKITVFLDDFDDFKEMNEVYATYFTSALPARSTVEVSGLALDVKVEIEAVAVK